ncbi:MAG TPA: type IV pilus assembly protein PilM [Candidatus Acidoferrales bacterium]|nr:type IV pilus assembly protein PilM [Candidatus Acidoferrales bacterium]
MGVGGNWAKQLGRVFTSSLSDFNPFRGDEPYLSIDIGSSTIKLLEVRGRSGQLRVSGAAILPTPPSAIQNNMVYETTAVADAARALAESRGMKARKVVTAVPGPAVIIKRVTLPAQSARELENTILFEAGNFIPEDLENVNLDYQITDYLDDGKRMEVLLVAAKKDIVASYTEAVKAAGMTPVVVDVDYFALENMFETNYQAPADRAIALVNIGARYSSINILRNGRSTFTGDVPVGGRDISESLMRDLGIGSEDAETLKAGGSLPSIPADQAAPVIDAAASALIDEIHHALSFFWTAATDETIDHIYLSGGVGRMPGLTQQLSERVGAPAEIANPFAHLAVDRAVDTPQFREQAADFAVAMGLATRRPDDK